MENLTTSFQWECLNTSAQKIIKYFFPNGELPFLKQIASGTEKLFIIEDLHNFGADYDKTLMAWHKNFTRNWEKLKKNYDEKFFRMWSYYLLSCAGNFRSRQTPLWQIVLSQNGIPGGYKSVRYMRFFYT